MSVTFRSRQINEENSSSEDKHSLFSMLAEKTEFIFAVPWFLRELFSLACLLSQIKQQKPWPYHTFSLFTVTHLLMVTGSLLCITQAN